MSRERGDLRKRYLALPWRGKLAVAWRLWRDRRVPLRARLLLPAVAFYLAMPIDIIPDFIPVLGQLDDVLVVVLALGLFIRMTPPQVIEDHIARWLAEHP
ncbi:MAG: DUF1232 domain-containing protein [Dehalococcoidia bacterium]|nr:DUF1232 domain-containing protein [Dehalococcoidia bacterium]